MRFYYFIIVNLLVFNLLSTSKVFTQCNATLSGNQNYSTFGGGCTTTPNGVTINSIGTGEILTFNVSVTVNGNMILNFVSAGSHIVINSGVTVIINGDLNFNGDNGAKTITVNGTLDIRQNFNAHNNVTYNGNGVVKVASNWQNNGSGADCPNPCSLRFTVNNCLQFNDPICVDSRNNPFLPITLIRFSGQKSNSNHIDFKWQTANELNNHYFSLQGSADGKNFIDFAKIEGRGTNNQIQNYQYSWLVNDLRWQYFRLKQVDFDGKEHIFNSIFIPQSFHSVKVYPQAFNKRLYQVEIPASLNGEVRLFSMDGKEIRKITFNTHSEDKVLEIDLSNLNTQFFLLKIQHQNGVDVFKIL